MNIDKAAIELLRAATSAESAANGLYEFSRILRGEKTMKTIKDAVIELGGKWPVEDVEFLVYHKKENEYSVSYDTCIHAHAEQIVCNEQEFESAAKRLGYINGSRWGVEYPTNGERPDLPDDVVVCFKEIEGNWDLNGGREVWKWNWAGASAFKITDPRYKPSDTSYLNVQPQAQSLTHSEEGLTHKNEISEAISAFGKLPNSLQDLYQESFDKWVKNAQPKQRQMQGAKS